MAFADTGDFDDFLPAPPSRTDDHDCRVAMIIQHFHRAYEDADVGDVVWVLEAAVGSIVNVKMKQSRLSADDRDRMLKALTLARVKAVDSFPTWCDPLHVALGFDAVSALILYWAEDDARRRLREPFVSEWHAHAHVLQHLARIATLLDDVDNRAQQRLNQLAMAA
jgi:hypothetical protein